MSLEVGEYQKSVIVRQILAHEVLLDHLAARNSKLHVRTFRIQQIYVKILAPAMLFQRFQMLLGGISAAFICSVALGNSAAYLFNDGFPEFRFQEVLVARLAGVQFDGCLLYTSRCV